MAFGYKVPKFNLWGRYWRLTLDGDTGIYIWIGPRYFRCQFKHEVFTFRNSLSVPKWSWFRPIGQTPDGKGDIVQIAGNEFMWFRVVSVLDIGVGFANEYRQVSIVEPQDTSPTSVKGYYWPSANPTLEPPEGAEMLQTINPLDDWQDPFPVPPVE